MSRSGAAVPAHAARLDQALLHLIADEVGTPCYVYDARALDAGLARWTQAFGVPGVWYSVKANGNLAVLRRLAAAGIGFEVATSGEFARARAAGVPVERLLFGGVPRTPAELEAALRSGAEAVVLQAPAEVREALDLAEAGRAGRGGRPARVGLRVRPSIRAGAHPALETATPGAKFGLLPEAVVEAWARLSRAPGLEPVLLGVHLGSGVEGPAPYREALGLLLRLAREAAAGGRPVEVLDVGGGLAVRYEGREDPDPGALAAALRETTRRAGTSGGSAPPELRVEPGRSVVARAGLLLTRVLYPVEAVSGRPAVVCDAAFTDFTRHVLYGADHRVEAVPAVPAGDARHRAPASSREAGRPVDLLGVTCESGDVLARGCRLGRPARGDLLALRDAGAYGFAMASNYNGRRRPAEVLAEEDAWRVVRRRERVASLWEGEAPPGEG